MFAVCRYGVIVHTLQTAQIWKYEIILCMGMEELRPRKTNIKKLVISNRLLCLWQSVLCMYVDELF